MTELTGFALTADEIRAGMDHHAAADFDLSVRSAEYRAALVRLLAHHDETANGRCTVGDETRALLEETP